MRYAFLAEMDDGQTLIGEADGRDIRKWEATYKASYIKSEVSITGITQLAYLALRRTKVVGQYPTYELFDEHCINVVGVDESPTEAAVAGDPTPPEATADTSAS